MNTKNTLAAIAVAVAATAANGQAMIVGTLMEQGAQVQNITAPPVYGQPFLNFRAGTAERPGPSMMSINNDGTIAFSYQATIDFAGFAGDHVQPVGTPKYVLVFVNGQPMLLPLYHYAIQGAGRE